MHNIKIHQKNMQTWTSTSEKPYTEQEGSWTEVKEKPKTICTGYKYDLILE